MKLLVAMSGGVDSSVAAAHLVAGGHDVTGVTLKLWGGDSDTGCCSVADVDDARRVADRLGIQHLVFNLGDDFQTHVIDPYVDAHRQGHTPNPCIECNRRLKFDALVRRAEALGFEGVATGHHARLVTDAEGRRRLARGADAAKDQSYVLYVVDPGLLDRIWLPVGELTKTQVRAEATRLGLRTAAKPDSQDVCFITRSAGRRAFLAPRLELHPAPVVDGRGHQVGQVAAVELVTVGQRRGLGLAGQPAGRYAVDVDVANRVVRVGTAAERDRPGVDLEQVVWAAGWGATRAAALDPAGDSGGSDDSDDSGGARTTVGLTAQSSAHGHPRRVVLVGAATSAPATDDPAIHLRWVDGPQPRVAPGQSVVLYQDDLVVGGGIAR